MSKKWMPTETTVKRLSPTAEVSFLANGHLNKYAIIALRKKEYMRTRTQ